MIEKGGPNLGRARVGRLDEDNELGIPSYAGRSTGSTLGSRIGVPCLFAGLCQFSGIEKTT